MNVIAKYLMRENFFYSERYRNLNSKLFINTSK